MEECILSIRVRNVYFHLRENDSIYNQDDSTWHIFRHFSNSHFCLTFCSLVFYNTFLTLCAHLAISSGHHTFCNSSYLFPHTQSCLVARPPWVVHYSVTVLTAQYHQLAILLQQLQEKPIIVHFAQHFVHSCQMSELYTENSLIFIKKALSFHGKHGHSLWSCKYLGNSYWPCKLTALSM